MKWVWIVVLILCIANVVFSFGRKEGLSTGLGWIEACIIDAYLIIVLFTEIS